MAERLSRDLAVAPHGRGLIVAACDSAGGVGPLPADALAAPGQVVGRFTARVAAAELLAVGAMPVLVSVTCCVAPDPCGALLAGVRAELADVGVPGLPLVATAEKNLATVQTGIGVTLVGTLEAPWPVTRKGDGLYLVGIPKVGAAVRLGDPEIADLPLLRTLLPQVSAVIPAGSRGAWHEAEVLAAEAGLTAIREGDEDGDLLSRSAGPATALVAAAARTPRLGLPVLRRIGWLR